MNAKEKKELAVSKLLLLLLAAFGVGAVIWLGWAQQPAPRESGSLAAHQSTVRQTVPPAEQQKTTAPAPAITQTHYLAIPEWAVRAPLTTDTADMLYHYTTQPESTTFTFKRLTDAGICDPSVGVTMTRSTTQYQPPYDPSNPAATTKVGDYYYYLAYAGEPCTAALSDGQKQAANTIHNGDLTGAVRGVLEKLEAY